MHSVGSVVMIENILAGAKNCSTELFNDESTTKYSLKFRYLLKEFSPNYAQVTSLVLTLQIQRRQFDLDWRFLSCLLWKS
ncbi:unnamed protein product [Phytomonas sp. EM1]|nr:unnamed protein product [Phytomonas sp. EM1]|eukprot:CCW60369.1 unnamed protein product [Phytomonas sp. isolate EM1]